MTSAEVGRGSSLRQLARLHGVQTAYYDVSGLRKEASRESLLRVLRALGTPAETLRDVPAALRERRQALWQRGVEPVIVAWEGSPAEVKLSLPVQSMSGSLACELKLEGGEVKSWRLDLAGLPTVEAAEIEGVRYVAKSIALPAVPWGYHELAFQLKRSHLETMIIGAPARAYGAPDRAADRVWGVFLPLYALHSRRSWGAGDFSDLEALMDWLNDLGGTVVATLPLLASFLDEPFDPSPYAPVSRLFWNEFYVDVTRVPELARCPAARSLLASNEVRSHIEGLRSTNLADYRGQMALKRRVLEELARYVFAEASERRVALRRFVDAHPAVEDYARFRAACERRRSPWPEWPEPLRNGVLAPGDYDGETERYHLYAQWVTQEQIQRLSDAAEGNGQLMYLDLPLGVHPHGYDVWRHRDVFAADVSGGAPPDAVFTKGQDWGFPPLHPEKLREQRYRYVIAYLRHHLQRARILRIDHVMGLHRLFWIPRGLDAGDGVYVRYPAQEFYAILTLESHRHKAWIVGENLGTVPSYVNPAMSRHNIHRMYVVHYELASHARRPLRAVSANSVASLNTHDMPPFAAFWKGLDIQDRLRLGLLNGTSARAERRSRQRQRKALVTSFERKGRLSNAPPDARSMLRAVLAFLASSPARAVLVNLEDLWLETQPQNVPGTWNEHPNWQRKARHSLEAFRQMPEVVDTLCEIDLLRKRGRGR